MKFLFVLAIAVCAGCVSPTSPQFTYAMLSTLQPGVTTRAEVFKTFGEPRSISISGGRDGFESISYFRRLAGYGYGYDSVRMDSLTIYFTNGIVREFFKTN